MLLQSQSEKREQAQSLASIWNRESYKYSARSITAENCGLKPGFLPNSGDCVLDAGCGAGTYLEYFSTITQDLHGVDISPKMIEEAKLRGRCEVGDITKLAFEDASFTYVLSFLVVSHCGNSHQALSELSRVLRPNGRLVLVLPNSNSMIALERKFMMSIGKYSLGNSEHYSLSEIRLRLEGLGLKVEDYYTLTRKPECFSLFRQAFANPAFLADRFLTRILPHWGECWVIQARK